MHDMDAASISSPALVEQEDFSSATNDVEQLELQQQALEDALERNKLKLKQAKLKRKAELEDSAKKAHDVALGNGANAQDVESQCSVCFAVIPPELRIFMPCYSREGSATFTCSKCINVICPSVCGWFRAVALPFHFSLHTHHKHSRFT